MSVGFWGGEGDSYILYSVDILQAIELYTLNE